MGRPEARSGPTWPPGSPGASSSSSSPSLASLPSKSRPSARPSSRSPSLLSSFLATSSAPFTSPQRSSPWVLRPTLTTGETPCPSRLASQAPLWRLQLGRLVHHGYCPRLDLSSVERDHRVFQIQRHRPRLVCRQRRQCRKVRKGEGGHPYSFLRVFGFRILFRDH